MELLLLLSDEKTEHLTCNLTYMPSRRLFLVFILTVHLLPLISAQSPLSPIQLDSIKQALAKPLLDAQRVQLLNRLSYYYSEKDTSQALLYLTESYNLASKTKEMRGLVGVYLNWGLMKNHRGKFEEALNYYQKARDLAERAEDNVKMAMVLNLTGKTLVGQGKRKEAIAYFEQSLPLFEKNGLERDMAAVLNNLASAHNNLGNSDLSMQAAIRGLAIAEKYKDYGIESSLCNNISKLLYEIKRYVEATEYSLRAVKAAEKIGDERMLGIAYVNLANQYEDGLKEHQKAIDLYKSALTIFKKIGFQRGVQAATNNLAAMLYRQGFYDESLTLFKENLAIGEKGENKVGLPMNYLNIGRVLSKKEHYPEAKEYFDKAEETGRKYAEAAVMLEIFTHRATLDSAMNDFRSAFLYRNKQLKLQDSLMNEKTNRSLSDMKVKYETDKKQQQITLLNAQNQVQELDLTRKNLALRNNALELNQKNQSLQLMTLSLDNKELELFKSTAQIREKELENEKQQQNIKALNAENAVKALQLTQRNLWFGGLVGLFLLSGVLGYTLYSKRKNAHEATFRQAISQQKIDAAKAILEAEERERRRIAGDLHDGVAQLVVASKMQLTSMGAKLNFKTEQERLEYEKVLSLISESADEIRSVSHQMMPNALLRLGLVSALQEFVQKINGNQLSVYLDVQGLDQRMEAEVETTLYRVIQESVNNVIKHAQASRLDIQLIRDDKELSVTIEDNGKGFDSKNPAYTEGGLGLKNLRSRIEYLNGTLDIESSVGKGTLVAIYLPT